MSSSWFHLLYISGEEEILLRTSLSRFLNQPASFTPVNSESSHKNTFPNFLKPLTPNGPYSGRTAPLTSKRCILCIYSTNIGTEYFKHGINSSFFSS